LYCTYGRECNRRTIKFPDDDDDDDDEEEEESFEPKLEVGTAFPCVL